MPRIRRRVQVSGVVQGVGFRPYVFRLAADARVAGCIANGTAGVTIEVEGPEHDVTSFLRRLPEEAPPLALIDTVTVTDAPLTGETAFRIAASDAEGAVVTQIPADAATCPDCLRELLDPADRRHGYPFINCTNCGPRFTITRQIPYDRPQTSMASFIMCPQCQAEYDDPWNRRFHAQPNACWQCGPQLSLTGPDGLPIRCDDPIDETIRRLAAGEIVAIKGIGGFHLAVDASNQAAVERLRQRKHRYGKPLAVMLPDLEAVASLCLLTDAESTLLTTATRPVVLLRVRPAAAARIAPSVAPAIPWLGVFLPYTPLHHLLFVDGRIHALVMTSANLSEEPIAIDNHEALEHLADIADAFLFHDREILQRCDDSVMRIVAGSPQLLRRARGFVPLPLSLPFASPPLLAVGGHLKNVFCLAAGRHAYQSQHLGDLENLTALDFFRESLAHLGRTFEIEPAHLVHDLHPDYLSTRWAQQQGKPLLAVQHHHAHIASCMAEHALSQPVIGIALDGTGYGTDGHVWGGEVLICTYTGFERFAQLGYAAMPGSAAAIREPWRMAFSHLAASYPDRTLPSEVLDLLGIPPQQARMLNLMIERGINSPLTSSCGRLFDAAAAIVLGRRAVDYEAQAAMELEGAASDMVVAPYPYTIRPGPAGGAAWQIDTAPLFLALVAERLAGADPGSMSARFHATLADAYASVALRAREATGIETVCLSGGVFHNALLSELLQARLRSGGCAVYLNTRVSPGDGGLSYGQAAIAAAVLANSPVDR